MRMDRCPRKSLASLLLLLEQFTGSQFALNFVSAERVVSRSALECSVHASGGTADHENATSHAFGTYIGGVLLGNAAISNIILDGLAGDDTLTIDSGALLPGTPATC